MANVAIRIPNLAGGLNKGLPPGELPVNQTPDMQNFTVSDGVLTKTTGYAADSGTLGGTAGEPFLLGHHYGDALSGKKSFWAFTRQGIFQKDALADNWTDQNDTNSCIIIAGDEQYWSVCEIPLISSYKNHLIAVQANSSDPYDTSNGQAAVLYTDAPDKDVDYLPGADGYNADAGNTRHICKQVIAFQDHLFLLATYENTASGVWTKCPYRVRWSDTGAFTQADDWNPSASGSLAGYWDSRQGYGPLLRGELLRSKLVLYFEEAIVSCLKNDSVTAPFVFYTRVGGLGLYAPRLLVSVGDRQDFVGSDREIYEYWGGTRPEPIGRPVRSDLFGGINTAVRHRSFALHLPDGKAVGFAVPTGSSSYPNTIYLWFYQDRRWEKIVLPDGKYITGWGIWQHAGTNDTENMVILGDENGNIYHWDNATMNFAGTAIEAYVTTGVIIADLKHRFSVPYLCFEASGDGTASSVVVQYRTENESSFQTVGTVTVASDWQAYAVRLNPNGYRHQFRFYNNSGSEKLKLGRIWIDLDRKGVVG